MCMLHICKQSFRGIVDTKTAVRVAAPFRLLRRRVGSGGDPKAASKVDQDETSLLSTGPDLLYCEICKRSAA